MLDPRAVRFDPESAPLRLSGDESKMHSPAVGPAQAEVVTATFLFAYLQEADLPDMMCERQSSKRGNVNGTVDFIEGLLQV